MDILFVGPVQKAGASESCQEEVSALTLWNIFKLFSSKTKIFEEEPKFPVSILQTLNMHITHKFNQIFSTLTTL